MKEFHEEMVQPDKIYFFPNGNIAAYSKDGLQIVPLQRIDLVQLVISIIESNGFDPSICEFHLINNMVAIPIKTEFGTWELDYKNK